MSLFFKNQDQLNDLIEMTFIVRVQRTESEISGGKTQFFHKVDCTMPRAHFISKLMLGL